MTSTRHQRFRVRVLVWLTALVAFAVLSHVSGAEPSFANDVRAATAPTTSGSPDEDLRSAARAWTNAFLKGTVKELRALQGPECKSRRTSSLAEQRDYMHRLRVVMRRVLGVALDDIDIVDIQLRNVTPESGEAHVVFDLPPAKAGNDNWVEYRLHNGRWKVANCRAPIGGQSVSATSPR
jgi:hypothetical protein